MIHRFLILGATVSCAIATFVFFYFGYSLLWFWPIGIHHWDYFLDVGIFAVYLILAFTPMVMLIQSRKIKKPRRCFIAIGVIEVIVIGLFFAMWLRMF